MGVVCEVVVEWSRVLGHDVEEKGLEAVILQEASYQVAGCLGNF